MGQRILLNDRQIELLLAIIDCFTEENAPDNFWDRERQRVFHYDKKGERVEELLEIAINRLLDPDKLDI